MAPSPRLTVTQTLTRASSVGLVAWIKPKTELNVDPKSRNKPRAGESIRENGIKTRERSPMNTADPLVIVLQLCETSKKATTNRFSHLDVNRRESTGFNYERWVSPRGRAETTTLSSRAYTKAPADGRTDGRETATASSLVAGLAWSLGCQRLPVRRAHRASAGSSNWSRRNWKIFQLSSAVNCGVCHRGPSDEYFLYLNVHWSSVLCHNYIQRHCVHNKQAKWWGGNVYNTLWLIYSLLVMCIGLWSGISEC